MVCCSAHWLPHPCCWYFHFQWLHQPHLQFWNCQDWKGGKWTSCLTELLLVLFCLLNNTTLNHLTAFKQNVGTVLVVFLLGNPQLLERPKGTLLLERQWTSYENASSEPGQVLSMVLFWSVDLEFVCLRSHHNGYECIRYWFYKSNHGWFFQ